MELGNDKEVNHQGISGTTEMTDILSRLTSLPKRPMKHFSKGHYKKYTNLRAVMIVKGESTAIIL